MKNNTKINWYDLKNREYLYLKKNVLKDLIKEGTNKAGSLSKLCIKLGSTYLYSTLRQNLSGISIKKLKHLLDYVEKEYDFINNKIIEIRKGKRYSIKNPKFPINLSNISIGMVLGNIVSDGCLYYDISRKNFIRTKYFSDNKQGLAIFLHNIKEVFGEVYFNKEYMRNCYTIRIGNSIVGETLKKAGAPVGRKYVLNEGLPWVIEEGNRETKKSYLSAIFDDEGSIGCTREFPYTILSRNIHVKFTNKENKILSSKPKILIAESDLLKNEFGITNYTYVMSLNLTSKNHWSVGSSLVIRNKKDLISFYRTIGFSLSKKQNKLKEALINIGWMDHGTRSL